jgi:hypothetical protein
MIFKELSDCVLAFFAYRKCVFIMKTPWECRWVFVFLIKCELYKPCYYDRVMYKLPHLALNIILWDYYQEVIAAYAG